MITTTKQLKRPELINFLTDLPNTFTTFVHLQDDNCIVCSVKRALLYFRSALKPFLYPDNVY